jgi:large subunit ribosomal protein L22
MEKKNLKKTTPVINKTTKAVKPAKAVKPIKVSKDNQPDKKIEKTIDTVRYFNKDIKISPRKLRLLANSIKKENPFLCLERLKFVNSNASRVLQKGIKNAIANAKNQNFDQDSLRFHTIIANEGMKIKRMDKSHGYYFSRGVIIKRHSRLEIILAGFKN